MDLLEARNPFDLMKRYFALLFFTITLQAHAASWLFTLSGDDGENHDRPVTLSAGFLKSNTNGSISIANPTLSSFTNDSGFITTAGTATAITGTISGTQVSGTVGNAAWAASTDIAAATDYTSYFDADQNALSATKTYSDFNTFFGPELSGSMDIGYPDGPIGTLYPTAIRSGSNILITHAYIGLGDHISSAMSLYPSGRLDTTGTISAVKFVGNLTGTATTITGTISGTQVTGTVSNSITSENVRYAGATYPTTYLIDGDSLYAGDGFNPWSSYVTGSVTAHNNAAGGDTLEGVLSEYASQTHPYAPATTHTPAIFSFLEIHNAINNNTPHDNAAKILTLSGSLVTLARADGFYPIIAATGTPSPYLTGTDETTRTTVNTALLSGSSGADMVMDLASAFPNNSDAAFYQSDHLHYTNAVSQQIASWHDRVTGNLPSGVQASLQFEVSGSMGLDSSGTGNHFSTNGALDQASGKVGNGVVFSEATGAYLTAPNTVLNFSTSPHSFSYSGWYNLSAGNSDIRMVYHLLPTMVIGRYSPSSNYCLQYNASNNSDYVDLGVAPTGSWDHIVISCSGTSRVRVWINNAKVYDQSGITTMGPTPFNSLSSLVGWAGGPVYDFSLDELVYFNRELEELDVSTLYKRGAGRHAPDTSLGYYLSSGLSTSFITVDGPSGAITASGNVSAGSFTGNLTGTATTITGTIPNTQVSGLGSAALVSTTTFATIAQLAATNTIYVSPNGNNTTGTANDQTRPYATLTGGTGAFAAAQALGKPSLILMASGSYSETSSIVTGSNNITISGMGQPATSLYFTGSAGIMVSSSNITIQNIALNRIGSNGAQVLGCSGTGFSSYIYGFVMNNVGVTNVSGTAIGTFMGTAYNCNITGMTAIDWCYGGILNNSTIIGHDPALSATSYCIKDIQSVSNPNNNRAIWSQLIGCYLVDDDTLGCVLNGISESSTGDRISSRYTPSFAGSVSAYPAKIVGCYLEGPVYTTRTGYYTGFVVRGTLRFAGTEVYGCSNTLSYIHDTDGQLDAIALEASGTNTAFADHIISSEFRAGTWITYGIDQYTNISNSIWQGCNIQNNAEQQIRGMQKYFVGCVATGVTPNPPDIIGWQNANDMALRLSGTTNSIADINAQSPIYNSPNMTVEFWFRSNNCNDTSCLISWNNTYYANSWAVYAYRTTSPQIYWYGGGNSCVKSGQVMDGTWHHFAATVTSGTSVSVFVDGTYGATSAIAAISGSGDMIIGAHNSGSGNADYFKGDIAALRISSVNRYPGTSSFTPKINFPVDSCTIGLWASQQDGPEIWKDQTNTNNLLFNWQTPAQTNPYWVRRALPYTLY